MRLICPLFIVLGASLAADLICYEGTIKQPKAGQQVLDRGGVSLNKECKTGCVAEVDDKITFTLSCKSCPTKKHECHKNKKDGKITCCCAKPLCNGYDAMFTNVYKLIGTTTKKTNPTGMTTTTTTTPTGQTPVTTTPNENKTTTTTKAHVTTTGAAMPHGAVVLAATAALLLVLIN